MEPRTFQLKDGDGIVITKEAKLFYHVCCRCGLKHKVEVHHKKNSIILRFFKEGGEYGREDDIQTDKSS